LVLAEDFGGVAHSVFPRIRRGACRKNVKKAGNFQYYPVDNLGQPIYSPTYRVVSAYHDPIFSKG
jgi:hypothetical protein